MNLAGVARFVPPILLDLVARRRPSAKTYETYEAALADADSYEDPLLTELVAAKGKQFAENLQSTNELDYSHLRILLALVGSPTSQPLRILDFGGGSGTHYWVAKKLLGESVELDWRVVETPAMVEAVKRYELANNELTFYSNVQDATAGVTFDAVYASSSIHYTPEPYKTLEELCNVSSRRLIITRTPIADHEIILLQESRLRDNGPGQLPQSMESIVGQKTVSYPVSILSERNLCRVLTQYGKQTTTVKEDRVRLNSSIPSYQMYGVIFDKTR